jgi:hypothetical protein
MGSVDEGWSHDQGSAEISVELNEVALATLASGDPCLMPCVDCGLVTNKRCDLCWGEDHFPQDKWAHGRLIPLCSRCDIMYQKCHFCRGEDWCVPPPHRYLPLSVVLHHTYLQPQDRLFTPLSINSTHKDEKQLLQNREKKWDPVLQEYVYLLKSNRGCTRRLAYLSACVYTKVRLQPHPCYRV